MNPDHSTSFSTSSDAKSTTSSVPFVVTRAGVRMPALIYGTAWKKDRTADLVVQAVEAGFRGIDTACQPKHYFEPGVGEALKRLASRGIARDSLFLQTKFTSLSGQDPNKVPYDPNAPLEDQVAQSFAASQANLGTEYVDSLVLHGPLRTYNDTLIVWRAMERLASEGKVKQLGISNCYDLAYLQRLFQDAKVKPAVVQNRFYRDTQYDRELRAWCRQNNIYYQSFWTLTANPHILSSAPVRRLSTQLGKTEAQVFFRYLSLREGIVPLTGTTSVEHMRQDLDAFRFEFGVEHERDLQEISAALR